MQPVNLFELASQQAQWVTARQKVVANNIANVNTNGFAPSDIVPFKEILSKSASGMMMTDPKHITTGANGSEFKVAERERDPISGRTQRVSIEDELIAAGEVRKTYEMNTAIVKSFHRMILMTARAS